MSIQDEIMYKNTKSIASTRRGYAFGRLLYTGYPHIKRSSLIAFLYNLHLVSHDTNALAYRLATFAGYNARRRQEENGNMLPELTEEEITEMGKIAHAGAQAVDSQPKTPFVKASDLASYNSVFCIEEIRKVTGQYGPQWLLKLLLDENTSNILEVDEQGRALVTISVGKSGHDTRDVQLEILQEDLPAHCGTFIVVDLKNGATFMKLSEVEGQCPCGEFNLPEPEDSGDPFLPDSFEELTHHSPQQTPPVTTRGNGQASGKAPGATVTGRATTTANRQTRQ